VLDRSATELLAGRLTAADPKEILYALDLFRMGRQQAAHPGVRGLLSHPAHEVRQKAVTILSEAGDTAVVPQVEQLLQDPHLGVRTEALLYLARHAHVDPLTRIESLGNFPDFSVRSAVVAFLARPGEAQNIDVARLILDAMVQEHGLEGRRTRLEAARLLGFLPDHFAHQHLWLLYDEDMEVVRETLRAVTRYHKRWFVPRLLELLGDPALCSAAADALSNYGEDLLPALISQLSDTNVPAEARRQVPGVLARLGCPEAARALNEAVLESDASLRLRIISALNKLYQTHPELERDRQMLETILAAEILGHYRSYQILGTLGDGFAEADDSVAKALHDSMGQEIERIFRLLSLLHPGVDLHSAYYGVQSENPVVHDNALEFLDNVLQPHLRKMLVPLVDSTVTVAERVRLASRLVGAEVESPEQAVAALIRSDDPWLKSCGAYAVGTLGLRSLEPDLDECLNHPDPLLRETARQAKLRLAALAPAG
jgi:AAA family ATP:ADP antiporter